MKKTIRCWALKVRGRRFYTTASGVPWTFFTRKDAVAFAEAIQRTTDAKITVIRVLIKAEEIT